MSLLKAAVTLAVFLLLAQFQPLQAESHSNGSIQWMTNYEQAKELSQQTRRPIVLFFTGSDWCKWCVKMEKEIFDTKEFSKAAADKLIFVKLDYPMKKKLDPALQAQNDQLQREFSINSFPTLILLDPDQHPIGSTGYLSGGGKQYAVHLFKLVDDYIALKQKPF